MISIVRILVLFVWYLPFRVRFASTSFLGFDFIFEQFSQLLHDLTIAYTHYIMMHTILWLFRSLSLFCLPSDSITWTCFIQTENVCVCAFGIVVKSWRSAHSVAHNNSCVHLLQFTRKMINLSLLRHWSFSISIYYLIKWVCECCVSIFSIKFVSVRMLNDVYRRRRRIAYQSRSK